MTDKRIKVSGAASRKLALEKKLKMPSLFFKFLN